LACRAVFFPVYFTLSSFSVCLSLCVHRKDTIQPITEKTGLSENRQELNCCCLMSTGVRSVSLKSHHALGNTLLHVCCVVSLQFIPSTSLLPDLSQIYIFLSSVEFFCHLMNKKKITSF
jgi:hypothetical protein